MTVEPVKGFPIVVSPTKCIWQEARYEKQDLYCMKCYWQGHTVVVCRVGERCKEDGKPKDKRVWQPKTSKTRCSSLGTKDDKELEANVKFSDDRLQVTQEDMVANVVQVANIDEAPNIITAGMTSNIEGESMKINQSGAVPSILMSAEMLKDPLQDSTKIADNQNDVSDEECEEVWCDKENDEDLEIVQMQDKEFLDVPTTLVAKMVNINYDNRLQGELAMGYSLERDDGEII